MRFIYQKKDDDFLIIDTKTGNSLFCVQTKETVDNVCNLLNQQEEYIEYLSFCVKKEKLK